MAARKTQTMSAQNSDPHPPDDTTSRRRFLRWLGSAPVAAALVAAAACDPEALIPVEAGDDATGPTDDTSPTADIQQDTGAAEIAPTSCETTGRDVEGPFHIDGAPFRATLASPDEPGERLHIEGTVYSASDDCRTPLEGALLDVWHADATGAYHDDTTTYRLRGQLLADAEGRFAFDTIRPGHYPQGGSVRPAHIHFMVSAPGHVSLTTQLYFAGDAYLAPADPCTTCNSEDDTLVIPLAPAPTRDPTRTDAGPSWTGRFDIVLSR